MQLRLWLSLVLLPAAWWNGELRAASSTEAVQELTLANPGFEEQGDAGAPGWLINHWFKTPDQEIAVSKNEKKSGNSSLKIVLREPISSKGLNEGTFQISLSQRLPDVQSGSQLRISFWYKTTSQIPLEVAISGGSGCERPVNRTGPWQTKSDGEWQQWVAEMDIRQFSESNVFYKGQAWLELMINGSVIPLPATLYLDDFRIEVVDPLKALVEANPEWLRRLGKIKEEVEKAEPEGKSAGKSSLSKWNTLKSDLLAKINETEKKMPSLVRLSVGEKADTEEHLRGLEVEVDGFVSGASLTLDNLRLLQVEAISNKRILPTDPIVAGRITDVIELTAAKGEYEAASFVLQATGKAEDIQLEATAFGREDGKKLNLVPDIRVVKSWYQDEAMQLRETPLAGMYNPIDRGGFRVLMPELLVYDDALIRVDNQTRDNYVRINQEGENREICVSRPEGVVPGNITGDFPVRDAKTLRPISIPRGENRQFWITVRVPEDASPGRYVSEVKVTSGKTQLGVFLIALEVLPFNLPKPFAVNSIYYRPPSPQYYQDRVWNQFQAEIENLVAHGIDVPVLPLLFPLGSSRQAVVSATVPYKVTEVITFDPTAKGKELPVLLEDLKHKLGLMKQSGVVSDKLFIDGLPVGFPEAPEELAELEKRAKAVVAVASEYGYSEVYFYGLDEARLSILEKQRPAWQAVQRAGGKVFAAGSADQLVVVGDLLDLSISIVPPERQVAAKWHEKGKLVAAYGNPQGGVEQGDTYRRNFGIGLWQAEFDGGMTYIYHNATIQNSRGVPADSHTISWASSWNDFCENPDRTKQHNMVYPTADGVLDTIQWEGYREGLDDVRYLRLLEELVARYESSKEPAVEVAKVWLKKLKESPINLGSTTPSEVRAECIRHILDLKKLGEGEVDQKS